MIVLDGVTKRYGDRTIVSEVSLELREGELTVFLGPSGCGKTTTLKLINRLLPLTAGRILIGSQDIAGLEPIALRRRIGYVIQEVGLFPHYRIFDNVALVPRLLGWPREKIDARVLEMLALVNLPADLLGRFPRELSGGQRQRVGVARALAGDPDILLMDEPFGAVDPQNRTFIQDEFKRIQRRLGKTVVMVTHDLDEALRLGDSVALFNAGRVEQSGAPADLLAEPATAFVADFLGGDRLTRLARLRCPDKLEAAAAELLAHG
ncbi:MAG: ABC transporter ATP-binding protein [Candidatus Sericytochromatia bacterium]|nr:ABC transporter ATP-binding protein [Candidatus Tanganyikabacteria bacterium]